ncbi:MAG: hypothetical protein ABMA64_24960 [Myxococcota bacterium]
MRVQMMPPVLSLFVGCGGLSPEDYAAQKADAWCALVVECDWLDLHGGSVDACLLESENGTLEQVEADSCHYDAGAAESCVDYARTMDCDSNGEGENTCLEVCG